MSGTKLSVNVNKVALLRNSRQGDVPSVVEMARLALEAGAAGITVHPRPDERHIRAHDVDDVAALLKDWPDREFNIEGNPMEGRFMEHCRRVRPHQCTLVPDSVDQSTSDHGWDVQAHSAFLGGIVAELKELGCRVSIFVDPEPERVDPVPEVGADRIELYTEAYAIAHLRSDFEATWARFAATAERAQDLGLGVNAGHDLNLDNLASFLKIDGVLEVSIGHALTADALRLGYAEAVGRYLALCRND
ncbi:MAG: pyridoxine 5'-phosphate synthase [Myxococcota bacterium]